MDDLYTCRIHTGRLIEARVFELPGPAEADAYSAALGKAVAGAVATGKQRLVLCADHRPVNIYPPAVADELSRLFSQMNSKLVRVGIIAARSNATLSMQLGRIIREANNPNRQLFYEQNRLTEFLAAELNAEERERLREFLDQPV